MRRGEIVPLPRPAEDQVAREIRLVGDRAVGVALWVRGLAAAVRLDALARLALGVAGPARLEPVFDREVPVGRLPVRDPVRADDPRVADVDHVRGADVQTHAEAGREYRRGGEQPDRPDRDRAGAEPSAPPAPDHAPEQVEERWVGERDAREDIAAVEEPERHREGEQRDQVEVAHAQGSAQVGEADEEQQAEAEPDGDAVDLPAAESAVAAARHLPGDLWAGPGLGDCAASVVHAAAGDLARRPRPNLDGPALLLEVCVGLADPRRIVTEPGSNLAVAEKDPGHLRLVEALLRRSERGAQASGHGSGGRAGECRADEGERGGDGRDEGAAHRAQPSYGRGPGTTTVCSRRNSGA